MNKKGQCPSNVATSSEYHGSMVKTCAPEVHNHVQSPEESIFRGLEALRTNYNPILGKTTPVGSFQTQFSHSTETLQTLEIGILTQCIF